ncbi:MAG: cell wall-binding repeat-containing protein, partial [Actinobacteria bacterium]
VAAALLAGVAAAGAAGGLSAQAAGTVTRIAGPDRYRTAAAASAFGWNTGGTVVIATGANFPDALCGAPLAHAYGGPILLTPPAALPASVTAEIARLGATSAIVLGGTGAVSAAVEGTLRSQLGGWETSPLGGNGSKSAMLAYYPDTGVVTIQEYFWPAVSW